MHELQQVLLLSAADSFCGLLFHASESGLSMMVHAVRCFIVLTLCLLSGALVSHAQEYRFAPEVAGFVNLNDKLRLRFVTSANIQDGSRQQMQFGPSLDLYFEPILKLRRIFIFDLDQSKTRFLTISPGYRYLPQINKHEEHRFLLDITPRFPFNGGLSFADRNRFEFRLIDGVYSWGYRNRLTAERPINWRDKSIVPYGSIEGLYHSRPTRPQQIRYSAGLTFPAAKQIRIDSYYERVNEIGSTQNRSVNIFGVRLNIYLRQ